ncbi:hypothetical protein LEN26_017995 [Aphanomyces euteiches]|nr:hypothetical protein LEN26_017995 [Aphanomyces euteiches]
MAKIQQATESTRRTRVNFYRFSVVYSTFFVIKLAATPLLAYLTEPTPWSLPRQSFGDWDSFEAFNNGTYAILEQGYKLHGVDKNKTTFHDSTSNMFFVRFELELPPTAWYVYIVVMTFSTIYNTLTGAMLYECMARSDLFFCQHFLYFGFPLDDTCVWLEPLTSPNVYAVHYGKVIWESITWSWLKFIFRSLLTTYILIVLKKRYYSQYKSLFADLAAIGVDSKFTQYQVILGDPTCLILSDPFVTFVMLVDVWLGGAYSGISTVRVSQLKDLMAFALGCFYSSRYVWIGFFAMKMLSILVKRFGWEANFMPVDPAGQTPIMVIFQFTWSIFLPASQQTEAVDAAAGILTGNLIMASCPILFSWTLAQLKSHDSGISKAKSKLSFIFSPCKRFRRTRKHEPVAISPIQTHLRKKKTNTSTINPFGQRSFNDIKLLVLFAFILRRLPKSVQQVGGSLHELYEERPQHRNMALFSHRAADCFVLCYTCDGKIQLQLRLSLLAYFDQRHLDPASCIPTCTSQHTTSYATLNARKCDTYEPTTTISNLTHLIQNVISVLARTASIAAVGMTLAKIHLTIMAKTHHALRQPSLSRVHFYRSSIIYSTFFVLKLLTTPMLAYLTEPLPWALPQQSLGNWHSFEEFNNGTYAHLKLLHSQRLSQENLTTFYDSATNTFFLQFEMTLPSSVPEDEYLSFLVRFPGAIMYGNGIRDYIYTFLGQNTSERTAREEIFHCQHFLYFHAPLDDTCVWFVPSPVVPNVYVVHYGKVIWESISWSSFKFSFRALLTFYILFALQKRYYSNFKSLMSDLATFGVISKFDHYQIILGDPTCLILSDPYVTFVMYLDIWLGGAYSGISVVRVTQYDNLVAFGLGCFYLSRYVWIAFFAMKMLSKLVKRYGWEAKFMPVDPRFMSLAATVYAGPIFSIAGQTPIMVVFHIMWSIFIPSSLDNEAVDAVAGIVAGNILMASFPISISWMLGQLKRESSVYLIMNIN